MHHVYPAPNWRRNAEDHLNAQCAYSPAGSGDVIQFRPCAWRNSLSSAFPARNASGASLAYPASLSRCSFRAFHSSPPTPPVALRSLSVGGCSSRRFSDVQPFAPHTFAMSIINARAHTHTHASTRAGRWSAIMKIGQSIKTHRKSASTVCWILTMPSVSASAVMRRCSQSVASINQYNINSAACIKQSGKRVQNSSEY